MPSCPIDRRRIVRVAALVLASLGTVAPGPPAFAAAPASGPKLRDEKAAKAHFEAASAAYKEEDFATAAAEIEKAYEAAPDSKYLYPWAQALRQSGDCARAIDIYKLFLETDPPQKERDLTNENIVRCLDEVQHTAAGTVADTETEEGEETSDEVEAVEDGAELPTADDGADEATDETNSADGGSIDQPRPWYKDPVGGTLVGLGAGTAIAGGVMFGLARGVAADAESSDDHRDYRDLGASAQTQNVVGIALMGAGGALLVAGAVRWGLVARKSNNAVAVVPTWHRDHAGLQISGRF